MSQIDQQVAEENRMIPSELRFSQVIKGWSGSGFESSCRVVSVSFLARHNPPVGQISFEAIDFTGKRRLSRGGNLILSETDTVKFALELAPNITAALKSAKVRLQFADKHIDCAEELAAIESILVAVGAA